ncbi:MAG: hotdog domain-containing protein, partial [Phycisphaeraceae bacterium]|nr:hotdog domain-containing protein [Phycisphaeraceae bacterium]
VVARLSVRYRQPARYDDVVKVTARLQEGGRVKIDHAYEVRVDGDLLATGETTLVCVDRDGRPREAPADLFSDDR